MFTKYHALEYLCESSTYVCEIESLYVGAYDALCRHLKSMYALNSKRKSPAMGGGFAMRKTRTLEVSYRFHSLRRWEKGIFFNAKKNRGMNSAVLARSGAKSTLLTLVSVMFEIESKELSGLIAIMTNWVSGIYWRRRTMAAVVFLLDCHAPNVLNVSMT